MTASKLLLRSTSTRRIIVGPGPKSKGGAKAIRFDTAADEKVPGAKRLGNVHTVEGDLAEAIRKSATVKALASTVGLQLG